jgi:DNA replication protein DnaC
MSIATSTATSTCIRCGSAFPYTPGDSELARHLRPTICDDCQTAATQATRRQLEALVEADLAAERAARNVPTRYQGSSFETFRPATPSQEKALAAVRDHAPDGVLLVGGAGCGKTHLAAAAVNAGPTGSLFVATTELLDDIRRGFEGATRHLYERAGRAPLLVLDDLGQEAVTDWVRDRLYTLVNQRWNDLRTLIVTTNFDPDALAGRIGSGTTSRVVGLCRHRIRVEGVDYRKEQR